MGFIKLVGGVLLIPVILLAAILSGALVILEHLFDALVKQDD